MRPHIIKGVFMDHKEKGQSQSVIAIVGLVLAIIALLVSFVPIVNNGAFVLGLVGAVFAIVGIVQTGKGKRRGRGTAVAGLIVAILSLVIVLVTQSMYSAAIDSVTNGAQPTDASSSLAAPAASTDAASSSASSADYSNMAPGQSVDLDNGLSVSVDKVEAGLSNYDGSKVTQVTVTYKNNGSSNASFNAFDWKASDANGAQRDETYYASQENALNSGTLSAGGTVTGTIAFEGDITKVYYYSSIVQSDSNIAWAVS